MRYIFAVSKNLSTGIVKQALFHQGLNRFAALIMRVDLNQRLRPIAVFAVLALSFRMSGAAMRVKLRENALYSSINLSRKANTFCMISSLELVAVDIKPIAFLKGFDNTERVTRKEREKEIPLSPPFPKGELRSLHNCFIAISMHWLYKENSLYKIHTLPEVTLG